MENNQVRQSSQVLELQQLIAGPLIATIEADALSTQKYLSYVMGVAFESYNPRTGETGRLRMLTFSYNESDGNAVQKRTVNIPLLTLIPLPLLQIQEADFDFDIKILDTLHEKADEQFCLKSGRTLNQETDEGGFKMRASLAPQSGGRRTGELQQSLSSNMKIKVKMRQADMPAGMSNILHLTANNLLVSGEETESSPQEGGRS